MITLCKHHQEAVDYTRPSWSNIILSLTLIHLVTNRQTEKNLHIYKTFSNTSYSKMINKRVSAQGWFG